MPCQRSVNYGEKMEMKQARGVHEESLGVTRWRKLATYIPLQKEDQRGQVSKDSEGSQEQLCNCANRRSCRLP